MVLYGYGDSEGIHQTVVTVNGDLAVTNLFDESVIHNTELVVVQINGKRTRKLFHSVKVGLGGG